MGLKSILYSSKVWMESFAEKPTALISIFLLSFAESSFFPIPPDILLIAIAIASPKISFKAALWCSIGSILGGVAGYGIGYGLMETIGYPIVDFYNAHDVWQKVVETYNGEIGLWFLAGAAFTPIPYKISTIAAGATQMDLVPFVLISAIGRSARFFLVAGFLYYVGPKAKEYIDKYFDKLSIAFLILLVLGFVAIKYLL
jgi:membrane protein YqaA with SNARE-associated domain